MSAPKIVSSLAIIAAIALTACSQQDDSQVLYTYPQTASCSIDTPKSEVEITSGKKVALAGWAFNKANNSIPQSLTVYLINEDSKKVYPLVAKRGIKRPDVAKAFNNDALVDVGFSATIETAALKSGSYKVMLVQINDQAQAIRCKNETHRIKVK